MEKFSNCIQSNKYLNIVQNNDNIAQSMGLTGTLIYIDKRQYYPINNSRRIAL